MREQVWQIEYLPSIGHVQVVYGTTVSPEARRSRLVLCCCLTLCQPLLQPPPHLVRSLTEYDCGVLPLPP